MENKGLNIFNSRYVLASPETATDADYESIETIVAHEYFHNWTGNRITCRDWFQLCLKEGLTVFRDQQFSADQRSAGVQRIKDVMRCARASSARTRGRWPTRCGPRNTSRSTTSTPRPSTRRAPRSSACCAAGRRRRPTPARSTSTSSATTAQASTVEDWLAVLRGRLRPRPRAVQALVLPGRHAARSRRPSTGTARATGWSSPRRRRRRPASRARRRWSSPSPTGSSTARGSAVAEGVLELDRGPPVLRLGPAGAAGGLAAARLLRPGDPGAGGRSRRSGCSCSPTTATRSTSGRPAGPRR